jgi:hypothetical protein
MYNGFLVKSAIIIFFKQAKIQIINPQSNLRQIVLTILEVKVPNPQLRKKTLLIKKNIYLAGHPLNLKI